MKRLILSAVVIAIVLFSACTGPTGGQGGNQSGLGAEELITKDVSKLVLTTNDLPEEYYLMDEEHSDPPSYLPSSIDWQDGYIKQFATRDNVNVIINSVGKYGSIDGAKQAFELRKQRMETNPEEMLASDSLVGSVVTPIYMERVGDDSIAYKVTNPNPGWEEAVIWLYAFRRKNIIEIFTIGSERNLIPEGDIIDYTRIVLTRAEEKEKTELSLEDMAQFSEGRINNYENIREFAVRPYKTDVAWGELYDYARTTGAELLSRTLSLFSGIAGVPDISDLLAGTKDTALAALDLALGESKPLFLEVYGQVGLAQTLYDLATFTDSFQQYMEEKSAEFDGQMRVGAANFYAGSYDDALSQMENLIETETGAWRAGDIALVKETLQKESDMINRSIEFIDGQENVPKAFNLFSQAAFNSEPWTSARPKVMEFTEETEPQNIAMLRSFADIAEQKIASGEWVIKP